MKLVDLLAEEAVLLPFAAKDKWEAIDGMLDRLQKLGRLKPEQRKPVRDALVAREKIASTGLEHGVALPHATVDIFDRPMAAMALSPAGVPFQSADGNPARIIILIVIPRKTQKNYIRTLAGIARLLSYEDLRESLVSSTSTSEVIRVLREEEEKAVGG